MADYLSERGVSKLWDKIKATFQTLGNLVTAWGSTPSDTKYPSEKLVKTSLDAKGNRFDAYYYRSNVEGGGWVKLAETGNFTSTIQKDKPYIWDVYLSRCTSESSVEQLCLNVRYNSVGSLPDVFFKRFYTVNRLSTHKFAVRVVGAPGDASGNVELWAYLEKFWGSIAIREAAGSDSTSFLNPNKIFGKYYSYGSEGGSDKPVDDLENHIQVVDSTNIKLDADSKVIATAKTGNVNYKILATASASPTSGAATEAVYDTDISLNPSTNTISANISGSADKVSNNGVASADAARHIWFSDSATESRRVYDNNFTYNPAANLVTANISGNAATATDAGTGGNLATAVSNSHTHSNKTVLDGISATDISNWDAKADKPSTFTSGNVAKFDSNGNTVDSAIVADDVIVMKDAICNNGNNESSGYFKFAEIDSTTTNHVQLSCDYVFGYKTMLVQGKMEVNVSNISSDWEGDASPFKVLALEHLKGANATGIEIQGIATRSGTAMHVELWAKLTGEYRTLVVSRRFNKTLAASLSGSYWTFSSPSRTTTAPTVPSGGKSATATFRGTPSLRAVGTAYGNAGTPVYVTSGGLITACTVDSTPTDSSTNLVTSGGVAAALAGKQDKSNLIRGGVRDYDLADDEKYPSEKAVAETFRYRNCHVEAIMDPRQTTTFTNVGLYTYKSTYPIMQPENSQAGQLTGALKDLVSKNASGSFNGWAPCAFGCEDYFVYMTGYSSETTLQFELGDIASSPACRRFKFRMYNDDSYKKTVAFCHTYTESVYSGTISFAVNKSGRYETYLPIEIPAKRGITVSVLISSMLYNETGGGIFAIVDTNEEIVS